MNKGSLPTYESMTQCSQNTGIPSATLREAKRQGCPGFPANKGRVILADALPWIMRRMKWQEKEGEDTNYREAKAKAEAKLAQLEVEEKLGELVPMSAALKILREGFGIIRKYLQTAPSSLAPKVNPVDTAGAQTEIEIWRDEAITTMQDFLEKIENDQNSIK